jgi:hypothetical protein
VYDETIYNSCARARFAGCTYLRHIILGLNTVWFGWLSAKSQLASRVGEGGGVRQLCLHSVTQLTLPGPGGESREGGCVPSPWERWAIYNSYKVTRATRICLLELDKRQNIRIFA